MGARTPDFIEKFDTVDKAGFAFWRPGRENDGRADLRLMGGRGSGRVGGGANER